MTDVGKVLLLASASLLAPAAHAADAAKYQAPRNEYGQPDLRGVWNFSSDVPLQRPKDAPDKLVQTREDLENVERRAREAVRTDHAAGRGLSQYVLARLQVAGREPAHLAARLSVERAAAVALITPIIGPIQSPFSAADDDEVPVGLSTRRRSESERLPTLSRIRSYALARLA